jgi:NitT/TauT family transport system substrate-binding protein
MSAPATVVYRWKKNLFEQKGRKSMKLSRSKHVVNMLLALALLIAAVAPARAEVREVRLAKQYGLSYLSLIVMEENKLIEKHAKQAGLGGIKVSWATFGSGSVMNDALLSGRVDFASGGVTPLLKLWEKTKGKVKGVAAIDSIPIYLNSDNPAVRSIKDLSDKDRIALPAVKVSIQAVTLQMAAAKLYGQNSYDRLDRLTVSMKHPDAMAALLSNKSDITAHLASPPFMFQELEDPRVHTILNSFELLGGPHTFDVVWAHKRFLDANPRTYAAVFAALEEAIAIINRDKRAAAELYVKASRSKESVDVIYGYLTKQPLSYTTTPLNITKFSDFMYQTGSIKIRPKNWKDLFFPMSTASRGASHGHCSSPSA